MPEMKTTSRSVSFNPDHMKKALSGNVPLSVKGVEFTTLPTQMCYTEYAYSSKSQELKVHIWIYSPLDVVRRFMWERLAESFTPAALRWTEEAQMVIPPFIKGSIFIGLNSKPDQVMAVLKRIIEIDQMLVAHQVI